MTDDRSNCSLAKTKPFDQLNIDGETTSYTLNTCAGTSQLEDRCTKSLVIESLNQEEVYPLATVIECNAIPNNKSEIPTQAVARAHAHLQDITKKYPKLVRKRKSCF